MRPNQTSGWWTDASWRVRGLFIENPPLPDALRSWLFVCTGNLCRSPFAAGLAERILAASSGGATVGSAGLQITGASRCPENARRAARAYGVALESHVVRRLDARMAERFDVLVVMDAKQWRHLRRRWPFWRAKILLLPLFDTEPASVYERYHIQDPLGQGDAAFAASYARIDRATRRLIEAAGHAPAAERRRRAE